MSTYQIDSAHTHAQFKVRHLMVSNVKGDFDKVTGTVVLDDTNPTASSLNVTIASTSRASAPASRSAMRAQRKAPSFSTWRNFRP